MVTQPFEYLTTPQGILEHLQTYMVKDRTMSDPQHYMALKRGVQHVIQALEVYLADEGTEQ